MSHKKTHIYNDQTFDQNDNVRGSTTAQKVTGLHRSIRHNKDDSSYSTCIKHQIQELVALIVVKLDNLYSMNNKELNPSEKEIWNNTFNRKFEPKNKGIIYKLVMRNSSVIIIELWRDIRNTYKYLLDLKINSSVVAEIKNEFAEILDIFEKAFGDEQGVGDKIKVIAENARKLYPIEPNKIGNKNNKVTESNDKSKDKNKDKNKDKQDIINPIIIDNGDTSSEGAWDKNNPFLEGEPVLIKKVEKAKEIKLKKKAEEKKRLNEYLKGRGMEIKKKNRKKSNKKGKKNNVPNQDQKSQDNKESKEESGWNYVKSTSEKNKRKVAKGFGKKSFVKKEPKRLFKVDDNKK